MEGQLNGFETLKIATGTVDGLPDVPEPKTTRRATKLSKQQREHVAWLLGKGYGDFDEAKNLVSTHTMHVGELCDEFSLSDDFATEATGKDGPRGRNCCLTPFKRKGWICTRYGGAAEAGWKVNKNGNYFCFIGEKPKEAKPDPADNIVTDALEIDTLYNWQGTAYAEVNRHGRKENLLIEGEIYKRLLRVRFRNKYETVPKTEWMTNAISMLVAIATEEGDETPVYIRQAFVGGKLYVDLSDAKRRVIEIDGDGYRESSSCPVRFLRSDKMLPLPFPVDGGTLDDLKKYINCEPEDFPLWIGAILGMYLPTGTIPLVSLIGGDGRAKTTQGLVFLSLVDPTIVKGCSPPENGEDLMLAVQQRWLYFIDNLSGIPSWLSDALCRLASGGATERRTKYKDRDTSVFIAKRPCLITSITEVITKADLDSRTLKFDLPSVRDRRMTEAELWAHSTKPVRNFWARSTKHCRPQSRIYPKPKSKTFHGLPIRRGGFKRRNPRRALRPEAYFKPMRTHAAQA